MKGYARVHSSSTCWAAYHPLNSSPFVLILFRGIRRVVGGRNRKVKPSNLRVPQSHLNRAFSLICTIWPPLSLCLLWAWHPFTHWMQSPAVNLGEEENIRNLFYMKSFGFTGTVLGSWHMVQTYSAWKKYPCSAEHFLGLSFGVCSLSVMRLQVSKYDEW